MNVQDIATRIAEYVAEKPGVSIGDLAAAFACTCGGLRIEDYSEAFTHALTVDESIRLDYRRNLWPLDRLTPTRPAKETP